MSRITFTEDQYKNAVSRIEGNRQGEQTTSGKFAESKIQEACVRWFDSTYPELRLNLFSIPNERKADIKMNRKGKSYSPHGARMKALGRRRGVADLFLAHEGRNSEGGLAAYGLFIEFKAEAGKQSESQLEFELAVTKEGYNYRIVKSKEEFEKLINNYLNQKQHA